MRSRFPLYAKILLWFFLNLVALGAVFYVFFHTQVRLGLNWLVAGRAGDRIQAVSELITGELNETTGRAHWDEILKRFSDSYHVRFYLFHQDGHQLAGEPVELPRPVANVLAQRRPPRGAGGGYEKFMERMTDPVCYWVGVRVPVLDRDKKRTLPVTLLAVSDSIGGSGLFLDFTPWIMVGLGALMFSVLFWFPLVHGITRSIAQITNATEQVAEGRFDIRVSERRRDELGRLGQAINRMTTRLDGFVTGQKRFLGDVAHELCSPLARIQIALGILEQRADEKQRTAVEDVREEVQHMSGLVNELLSFTKAGLQEREINLGPVRLGELTQRVVAREAADSDRVQVRIDDNLQVLAEPGALTLALANLVRNALRYGGSGSVTIEATVDVDAVRVTITDSGPGVPPEALQQIFDPFYRLESSRSRDTGGVGLGLAIVKTCVETCGGSVTAQNCQPTGLQVEVRLRQAR
jgi:two-component system, OmpR family, sensor histidine kinase CpxA